ncbi:MAG: cytochrome c3 family protein [Deltaproteobacteria bacterium]|nr:cytochrome c3 family protein [Deltaproteobacteria bacterium]
MKFPPLGSLLCILALAIPTGLQAEPSVLPPSVDPTSGCAVCHAEAVAGFKAGQGEDGPHADVECTDCHRSRTFNPHVAGDLSQEDRAALAKLAPYGERVSDAYLACLDCHDEPYEAWKESIHGSEANQERPDRAPLCADCHGSPHLVSTAPKMKKELAARCIACHEFPSEGGAQAEVVDTYRETIHGKMISLGNDRAAVCTDCHGGHAIFPEDDPRSTVHADNRVATCETCHPGASESFTHAISHVPHRFDTDFWGGFTAFAFSLLTLGTIFLLFLHIGADFFRSTRAHHPEFSEADDEEAPPAELPVKRFDIHMRLQHGLMLLSFIVLGVTGWPLKAASTEASLRMTEFLGGQATLALIHRIAGVVMLISAVYHLLYLGIRFARGNLSLGLVPAPKDVRDLFANLGYFFGLRKERPDFGNWAYHEKFDYWAVFWGVAIMGGSGLLLWFPTWFAKVLPGHAISLGQIVHSDEALLAILAIFLWHFYNVHLRPTVFPMSWVWLNGTMPAEAYYEEHRGAYEKQFGKKPPRKPAHDLWHARRRWSYGALAIVVLAAVVVLISDASAIRNRIAELSAPGETAKPAAVKTPEPGKAEASPAKGKAVEGEVVVNGVAESACFACHNKGRFEEGGNFPHGMHFEEQDVSRDCVECHQATWHQSLGLYTQVCLDCHDAEELPIRTAPEEGTPEEGTEEGAEEAPTPEE